MADRSHRVSASDVAEYILRKEGAMSAMKLQKLVYYSQAWSLVWDERPLFVERIEAWANGPVCPRLYQGHKGCFEVKPGSLAGKPQRLDQDGRETIAAVLKFYGSKTAQELSELTHFERPWRAAREGIPAGERSSKLITRASMAEYYGGL